MTVHPIDLRFQGTEGLIAAFLVEGDEGAVLVETGPGSTLEALLAGIRALGHRPESLAGVFVTHIHLDHAGAAGWFARCGVPVHVHPAGGRHLIDPSRLLESARMVYGDRFDSLWGETLPAPAEQVVTLEDGEKAAVGGIEVEAVETPGHARHHHAYRLGGIVFTGDAAGAALEGSGFLSVTSAPPQFDLEATLASIERLRDLGASALYLTHFGRIDSPDSHLDAYSEAVQLAVQFVEHRLGEGMDPESLRIAYEVFQLEQAYRFGVPREGWSRYQLANAADMCADGIRLYLEKREGSR